MSKIDKNIKIAYRREDDNRKDEFALSEVNKDKKYIKIQVRASSDYLSHIQEFKIKYKTTKTNQIKFQSH